MVKFLPHYQFPTGLPLVPEAHGQDDETLHERRPQASEGDVSSTEIGSSPDLHDIEEQHELLKPPRNEAQGPTRLAPSRQVPKWGVYDLFPLSLFVAHLVRKGADIKGKKAARARMMLRDQNSWQNIPLEISLYLVRLKDVRRALPADLVSAELIHLPPPIAQGSGNANC